MFNGLMMGNVWGYGSYSNSWFGFLLVPLLLWSLVWKGLALYKSARREDKVWFVALLVINTMGILEILYYFLFSNGKSPKKKSK